MRLDDDAVANLTEDDSQLHLLTAEELNVFKRMCYEATNMMELLTDAPALFEKWQVEISQLLETMEEGEKLLAQEAKTYEHNTGTSTS